MDNPTVVFLHGFLGEPDEFKAVQDRLLCHSVSFRLPGHGIDAEQVSGGFAEYAAWFWHKIHAEHIQNFVIYGYSLGSRVSFACLSEQLKFTQMPESGRLCGIISESGNPGLSSKSEREKRLKCDYAWAERFSAEHINRVLDDWYRQGVFSDLSEEQRSELVQKRSANNGINLALVMRSLSLVVMPDYKNLIADVHIPFLYISGNNDKKFTQLAETVKKFANKNITAKGIDKVGHNCHLFKPDAVSEIVNEWLQKKFI